MPPVPNYPGQTPYFKSLLACSHAPPNRPTPISAKQISLPLATLHTKKLRLTKLTCRGGVSCPSAWMCGRCCMEISHDRARPIERAHHPLGSLKEGRPPWQTGIFGPMVTADTWCSGDENDVLADWMGWRSPHGVAGWGRLVAADDMYLVSGTWIPKVGLRHGYIS